MRVIVYFTLLALATGIALVRGTPVERALAATLLTGNLATWGIVQLDSSHHYASVMQWYFIADASLAVLLCAVAIRWPTWASILIAAFQLNGLLGHVVKLVSPETFPLSYALLLKIWAWSMVGVLLLSRWRPDMRQILSRHRWPYAPPSQAGHTARG